MIKKTMLLALAVASAAVLALPTAVSAQEIHWAASSVPHTLTLTAESEPQITCESAHSTATPSGTTGSIDFDLTGCHITLFGLTTKCHTTGSVLDNTLTAKGTYHLVTVGGAPAMLITTESLLAICAGISNMTFQGNVIGKIISPTCNIVSDTMTATFSATGSTQNDMEYTGANYDLTATTQGGAAKTASLTTTVTIELPSTGKLECT